MRHELQHYCQHVLSSLAVGRDIGRNFAVPGQPGGPPPRASTKDNDALPRDTHQPDQLEHSLRDVEFHTRLQDDIELFVGALRRVTFPQRRERLDRMVRDKFFSPFLANLKAIAPLKWRRAVSEIIAAVQREVALPADGFSELALREAVLREPYFGLSPSAASVKADNAAWRAATEGGRRLTAEEQGALRVLWAPVFLDAYGGMVDRMDRATLARHKAAVERAGDREYYLAPRWHAWDYARRPDPPQPERGADGHALFPPHPKLQ